MTASEQWGDQDLIDKLSRFGAVQGPDSYVGQLMTRGAKRLRELLGEPGKFKGNPPTPSVCRTVAGPCGCKGQCPPETLSSTEAREVAEAYASRDPAAIQAVRKKYLKEEESC